MPIFKSSVAAEILRTCSASYSAAALERRKMCGVDKIGELGLIQPIMWEEDLNETILHIHR